MNYRDLVGLLALFTQFLVYLSIFFQIKKERLKIRVVVPFVILEFIRSFLLSGTLSIVLVPIELYLLDRCIIKEKNKEKSLFYSLYGFYAGFILINFFDLAINEFVPLEIYYEFVTSFWLVSVVLAFLVHTYLLKLIKLDASLLKNDDPVVITKIIRPLNRTLAIAIFVLLLGYYLEMIIDYGQISHYTKYLVFAYLFMMVSIVILLNTKLIAYKEELFQREKEEQYRRLELYTDEIQNLYQTVRGFKHDYKNMLISLRETIFEGDLEQIKDLYQSILQKANVYMSETEGIDDLARLESPALKSLIYQKLQEAREAGIKVHFEIKDEIKGLKIELLDMIRIVSNLLDNAIEAAIATSMPEIFLAFVKGDDGYILHIKNSTVSDDIKLNKIYRPGYSTKGSGRGMGLFNVNRIISRYAEVSLQTDIEDGFFTQVMYMGG